MTTPTRPPPQRIQVLDVLRGIALLGMFMVHFTYATTTDTPGGANWHRFVELFLESRFWAMFAILFGVGFAVQLRNAEARGAAFVPRFLRRVAGLLFFGLIAEIFFGYHVLVEYALWALPLLLVRKWSIRALTMLLILCAMSQPIYNISYTIYGAATVGEVATRAKRQAANEANMAHQKAYRAEVESTDYARVVAARVRHIPWSYTRPWILLPFNDFTLFLIGLIALRLGLFDRPGERQRLIIGLMVFGAVSWAASNWLIPPGNVFKTLPLVPRLLANFVVHGGGLVRDMWLTFTYIGAVLLVAVRKPAWFRRMAPFGWTGRTALTNYMIQVMILDLLFSNYALGLTIAWWIAPLASIGLFGVFALLSRWWLVRFRYGPLEWIWRSITYWRRQPMMIAPSA